MAVAGREHVGDAIAGEAEQSGMPERYQPCIANKYAQAQRENGIEQDLARNIDIISARHLVRDHCERNQCQAESEVAGYHGTWRPNRPCGRNTRTSSMGRKRTKYASSGSSAWPKL